MALNTEGGETSLTGRPLEHRGGVVEHFRRTRGAGRKRHPWNGTLFDPDMDGESIHSLTQPADVKTEHADLGGFYPREVSYLMAAFGPLRKTEGGGHLKEKMLDMSVYDDIGAHVLHALECMTKTESVHMLGILRGLHNAIVDNLDDRVAKSTLIRPSLTKRLARQGPLRHVWPHRRVLNTIFGKHHPT